MSKAVTKRIISGALGFALALFNIPQVAVAESNHPPVNSTKSSGVTDLATPSSESKAAQTTDESIETVEGEVSATSIKAPIPVSMSIPGQAKYDNVILPPVELYALGPGDQLNIIDYSFADADKPPVSNQTTVLPDGTATIYPLGLVMVQGMNLKQLNDMVNHSHGGPPEIFVTVARPRPVAVRVLGDVVSPGIYTVDGGLFTSKVGVQQLESTGADQPAAQGPAYAAQNQTTTITSQPPKVNELTLLTALQLAGGVHETADITNIRVSRAFTGRASFVDLWRLVTEGDVSQDVQLRDGDTIFVKKGGPPHDLSNLGVAGERTRRVRVLGAVAKPGVYDMRPDDDLFSSIAKAGGFAPNAITSSIILTRKTPQGTIKTQSIAMPRKNLLGFLHDKGEEVARVPIKNGDVIVVTESAAKRYGPQIATGVFTALSAITVLFLTSRLNTNNN